jgi:hypothetical protein
MAKITESQLRTIIKQELKKSLKESYAFHGFGKKAPHQHEGAVADILDDMQGKQVSLGKLQSFLKKKGVAIELQELKDLILASDETGRDMSYWVEIEPMDSPASPSDIVHVSTWGSDL